MSSAGSRRAADERTSANAKRKEGERGDERNSRERFYQKVRSMQDSRDRRLRQYRPGPAQADEASINVTNSSNSNCTAEWRFRVDGVKVGLRTVTNPEDSGKVSVRPGNRRSSPSSAQVAVWATASTPSYANAEHH